MRRVGLRRQKGLTISPRAKCQECLERSQKRAAQRTQSMRKHWREVFSNQNEEPLSWHGSLPRIALAGCPLFPRPHVAPREAATTYRVTIRVPQDPGAVYLHPIRLADRLPPIAIPLRPRDPKVYINLQALVDRAYASGRYHRRLDYSKPCDPRLDGTDSVWADDLLRRAGKSR